MIKVQMTQKNWFDNLKPTKHFIERYYERIFERYLHKNFDHENETDKIFSDMNHRLLDREKTFIKLFVGNKNKILLPIGARYQIVIKNKVLITVLS